MCQNQAKGFFGPHCSHAACKKFDGFDAKLPKIFRNFYLSIFAYQNQKANF